MAQWVDINVASNRIFNAKIGIWTLAKIIRISEFVWMACIAPVQPFKIASDELRLQIKSLVIVETINVVWLKLPLAREKKHVESVHLSQPCSNSELVPISFLLIQFFAKLSNRCFFRYNQPDNTVNIRAIYHDGPMHLCRRFLFYINTKWCNHFFYFHSKILQTLDFKITDDSIKKVKWWICENSFN